MSRKFFIAAAGAAFFITAGALAASADVNFGINLYSGGGYPTYHAEPTPVYPLYPATDNSYDGYDNSDCGSEGGFNRSAQRHCSTYQRVLESQVFFAGGY